MIRQAAILDANEIYAIESEHIECPWSCRDIKNAITDKRYIFLVYDLDGLIAGYINISVAERIADINMVCVRENLRRRGIAKKLIVAAIDGLKKLQADAVFLEVNTKNLAAVNLYESLGFKKISERINYYKNGNDAVVYKLTL